jgi:hypothetical protein
VRALLSFQSSASCYWHLALGRGQGIIDMEDASDLPRIAEPWFLALNASIEATPAMIAEDLEKATPAIERAVKTFG